MGQPSRLCVLFFPPLVTKTDTWIRTLVVICSIGQKQELKFIFSERIDCGDEGFENDSDDRQHTTGRSGHAVTYPLRADRRCINPGVLDQKGDDAGQCLGICCHIWAWSKRRSEITFKEETTTILAGVHQGGRISQEPKRPALTRAECWSPYLPKKIANFLHEFRATDFPSLILPILSSDRSRLNVHAMLSPLLMACCCCFRNHRICSNIEYHVARNNISFFCRFGLPSRATGTSGCSEL